MSDDSGRRPLTSGTQIGPYVIESQLGEGGMGTVYRALDTKLDRPVAIKFLSGDLADAAARLRFQREAQLASSLNHPHILTVHDAGEFEGRQYLVTEFVDGGTLKDWARAGKRTWRQIVELLAGVADGLAAAHAAGITHRDIKPANILVANNGYAKLADFGLAKLAEIVTPEDATRTLIQGATRPGVILGTIAYMSPEQASGNPLDARSDIFSFGVVLYELLAGRRPFEGANDLEVLKTIIHGTSPPLPDEIPIALRMVVEKALEKDPAERYQTMREMVVDLHRLTRQPSLDLHSQPQSMGWITARRKVSSRAGIVTIALLAALGAAGWLYLRSPSRLLGRAQQVGASPRRLTLLISSENQPTAPALSPDGKMIAYVAWDHQRMDLFVGRVAGGGRVRLTDDEALEMRPQFSPDGERILFTRLGAANKLSEIWVVPTLGGQATRLVSGASDAAWSPDGSRIAFVLRQPGEGDTLATAAADGSGRRTVLQSDALYPFFRYPAWSPDGSQLAVVRSTGGIAGELWLVPLNNGSPRRLSTDPAGVFSNLPVFTPDGRGVIHQSNRGGATNLWIAPLDGSPFRQLTTGTGPDESPSVAHNGSIAFTNMLARCALIVHDLKTNRSREILTHSSSIWSPAFSPDGRDLAFSRAEKDGAWHIWIVAVEGGSPRRLTSGALPEIYPRFTPDGASVIYQTWSPEPDRIWRVPRTGGPSDALTPKGNDDDAYGDISPDGKWLAFAHSEGESAHVYVAPVAGGTARRLTDSASTLPRWSPDGRWIAFSPNRGYNSGIYVIGADGTGERRLSDTGGWPVWWPDGKRLGYLNIGPDGAQQILTIPFAGGVPQLLSAVLFNGSNTPFDVSSSGALLATSNCTEVSSEIWLLQPQQ